MSLEDDDGLKVDNQVGFCGIAEKYFDKLFRALILSCMGVLLYRYSHIEKDHLVKLLKQLLLNTASPSLGMNLGNAPNAADVPTLLGSGSFSLLSCMCSLFVL